MRVVFEQGSVSRCVDEYVLPVNEKWYHVGMHAEQVPRREGNRISFEIVDSIGVSLSSLFSYKLFLYCRGAE